MLEVPTQTRSLKDAAQAIFDYYRDEGQPISRSKAKRVAEQIGKGTFNPDPRLVVLPREVGQSGDGWVVADCGVGPVVVVVMQPTR
ncbi:hypothetical protein GCM10009696_32620 [Kocuria himachalensis]